MAKRGETAMKHARAWAASTYPGSLTIEAHAKLIWIPDGDGGRFPRSTEEDIWNVFDLMVFPTNPDGYVDCLQVTTNTGGVAVRRKKVEKWIREFLPAGPPNWLGGISVIAWIPRKHFRWWYWSWHLMAWQETEPVPAPLPKVARRSTGSQDAPRQSTPEDARHVFD